MKTFQTASRRRATIGLAGAALAAALAVSACSGSSGSSSGGKQTLVITGQYSGPSSNTLVNWWKAAAVDFKKTHPDVTVKINNIVTTSESTYYSKLDLLERSSSTSPNVVYEDSFLVQSDAAAGYLAPMPQLKNFSEWKDLYPTFQKVTEYKGTPYSMMTETDVQQVYFDKSLLEKAGLPANWKPTNLNDILTAAEAVKAKDPGVIPLWVYTGTPLGEASSFRGFQVLLDGTTSSLYDTKTGKWETGGPGFNQVFNFLADLHSKGLEEPTADWSNPNGGTVLNAQLMPKQKVAMAIDGSWVSTQWLPGQAAPWGAGVSTYSVADVPTANGQAPGVTNLSGGWSLAIPAKSSNQSLAYQFIETANSPALLAKYTAVSGQLPVEANVANNSIFTNGIKSDPLFQEAVKYAATTNYRPSFGPYNTLSTDIAAITGQVSLGQLSAAKAESTWAADVKQAAGSGNYEG
jgi:multiple sugar transport system substrate-binding protein